MNSFFQGGGNGLVMGRRCVGMRHVAVMVVVLLMEETEGAAKVGPAPEWSILPSRDVVASRAIDDLVCCLQNPKHCLFSHAWALVSISLRTTKETPQEGCAMALPSLHQPAQACAASSKCGKGMHRLCIQTLAAS